MSCDYCILQSPTKEQVKLVLWETVGRSHTARSTDTYLCLLAQDDVLGLEANFE